MPAALRLCSSATLTGMTVSFPAAYFSSPLSIVPIHSALVAIVQERHDVLVAQRVGATDDGIEVDRLTGRGVELLEARTHGSDPYAVVGRIGEGHRQIVLQPCGALATQFPTVRVPAADAPGRACRSIPGRCDPRRARGSRSPAVFRHPWDHGCSDGTDWRHGRAGPAPERCRPTDRPPDPEGWRARHRLPKSQKISDRDDRPPACVRCDPSDSARRRYSSPIARRCDPAERGRCGCR